MSCHVTVLQSLALHKFLQRAHSHRVVLRPFTWGWFSLVPRPSLKSGKRIWCSERQFLSHGAGPYFVKNVIIAFLYPELEFLTPQSIWTTTQPGLQKLETAAKSIGTAENRLRDKFRLVSKYDRLRHAIIIRSSATWLVISNPRSAPPLVTRNVAQNTRPSLHVREGLGTRLSRLKGSILLANVGVNSGSEQPTSLVPRPFFATLEKFYLNSIFPVWRKMVWERD